jgi:hypothetical protein
VKTCRRKVKTGVQVEHETAKQDRPDMKEQKHGEIRARQRLQPRHEALSLLPATDYEFHAAVNLEGHAQEKQPLNNRLTINQASGAHECNV